MAKNTEIGARDAPSMIPIAELAKRWQHLYKGGYRRLRSLVAEVPLPNDLTEVSRHMFGSLVRDTDVPSGLFYNQGFFLPGCDPADFPASREHVISPSLFYKMLGSVRTMQRGQSMAPEASAMREYSRSLFAATNAVPIGIIDIEYEALERIDFENLFLNEDAQFIYAGDAKCVTYRLFIAAPLFEAIECSVVSFVTTAQTTISTDRKGASYTLQIGKDTADLRRGDPTSTYQIRDRYLPVRIRNIAKGASALSWIAHAPAEVPLFTRKTAIARKVK